MPTLGIVHDPLFLQHDTRNHPEQPGRLTAVRRRLKESGLWKECLRIAPASAFREDLLRVHTEEAVACVEALAARAPGHVDEYTSFGPRTTDAAFLAAGSVMTAVREIMAGSIDRAFCLVRPPGHHARPSGPSGFCFFNSIAVGVRFLFHHYDVQRVAIIDFDAHHGNGIQETFYADPAVFYFSIHQDACFPFVGGKAEERGAGAGEGATLNIPLSPETSRREYLDAFERGLDTAFDFEPEFVFLAAGFDAHRLDPLSRLTLESEDFGGITRMILDRAAACPTTIRGLVSVLEGGYHLPALAESAEAHLRALSKAE